jgi:hypothetical protein
VILFMASSADRTLGIASRHIFIGVSSAVLRLGLTDHLPAGPSSSLTSVTSDRGKFFILAPPLVTDPCVAMQAGHSELEALELAVLF